MLDGPASAAIDAQTGVVEWPDPPLADDPTTIAIRAANSVGHGDKTWRVMVTVPPGSAVRNWLVY